MKIRLENENDYYEVENLTREAFWNVYQPGCDEHYIVHKLRNNHCFIKELAYVIEKDNKIIANIMYAKGNLQQEDGTIKPLLFFGPVSVLPEYQHKGYGKILINYTLEIAKQLGYNEVVITGNPQYYQKYGFVPASIYQIYYKDTDINEESPFFMIKILNKNKQIPKGIYSNPECYLNIDSNELEEYDKNFPEKTKIKKQGQIR